MPQRGWYFIETRRKIPKEKSEFFNDILIISIHVVLGKRCLIRAKSWNILPRRDQFVSA